MIEWHNLFAFIGIITCGCVAIFVIWGIAYLAKEGAKKQKRKYEYKHRFNKPPKAKCYCKDCKSYGNGGECEAHSGWYVADNWFCWCATPKD